MHHDSRVYLELRYDDDTCDVVMVHFRDRGMLPVEVTSQEFSMEGPDFTGDMQEEALSCLYKAVRHLHLNR